ncbi:MAG TPA: isoprenylcysteine carboxylmethyltransferase family protein [Candidatus Acidoferrales bacterium]|nr:isoprenylcysteine carboxylmethyltransferase family protein [Candidatus Acidoferrales bacterium]
MMPKQGTFWTRWRVTLGYPLAAACLWGARPTPKSLVIGACIAILGLAIRGYAAGYLYKGEGLATSGPYAYTRNPLYLGSIVLAAGVIVATWSWVASGMVAAYIGMFYPAVMRREEVELRARYGEAFERYALQVPQLWPSFRPKVSSEKRFSWAQYKRNREYEAAIGLLVALALLAVRMWLRWR